MASQQAIQAFFEREFPDSGIVIESVEAGQVRLRRPVSAQDLRPGGAVSGPFMMALADAALYAAIFSELGLLALAVTTNLTINFLSKPVATADVLAQCQLLKVGRQLVVGEVSLYSDGGDKPIAHAVGTYSIPPGASSANR
ncbi:PaaI family thioesterase [bacterium]|nr:PaaI family thioesterase [bacterium]